MIQWKREDTTISDNDKAGHEHSPTDGKFTGNGGGGKARKKPPVLEVDAKARASMAGRGRAELSDFEQDIYDKMGTGELPGERYNPKTGKWDPLT